MGAWNESINGNDTAQDLKTEYQAVFFYHEVEDGVRKLDDYVRRALDEDEWCDYVYSLADYMWKHGILTDEVRERALALIDGRQGLELWEEAGQKTLQKREKALAKFREQLLSPQPPKKKITVKLYLKPIFEPGDLVAIRLMTAGKPYLPRTPFSEDAYRACDGKYVVLRKVTDQVSYASAIVPEVKDHWAVFQLYGKVFDACPMPEELEGIPWADTVFSKGVSCYGAEEPLMNGTFVCESSLFYFRKRKFQIIGNDRRDLPEAFNRWTHIFFSVDCGHANPETSILKAIWKSNGEDL